MKTLDSMLALPTLTPEMLTVEVRNPVSVAEQLGHALTYACEIEADTANTAEVVRLIAGQSEATDAWEQQEIGHSQVYGAFLRECGLPIPVVDIRTPPRSHRLFDAVAGMSPSVRKVGALVVGAQGYINERTNMLGQSSTTAKLRAMGEEYFASAIDTMRKQEAVHAAYYLETYNRLIVEASEWQQWLVARLVSHGFRPVGANTPVRERQFAEFVHQVFGGEVDTDRLRRYIERVVPLRYVDDVIEGFQTLAIMPRYGIE